MGRLLSPLCPSYPCTWTSVCVVLHCDHQSQSCHSSFVPVLPSSNPVLFLSPCRFFRSWVCPPSPLCTPVLPQPQPLPLPPESARLTSPAGAHRVPTGLPPGRHHASVCLTHATPLGYCSPAATHHIDHRVLTYHWPFMLYIFFLYSHYTYPCFCFFIRMADCDH